VFIGRRSTAFPSFADLASRFANMDDPNSQLQLQHLGFFITLV